jgi:hypothetical protein
MGEPGAVRGAGCAATRRRADLVQAGHEVEALIEPDYCAHLVLGREGQHRLGDAPPALAALPAYSYGLVACWPWLQAVHVDGELESGGVQPVLELCEHGEAGLLRGTFSR